jgi:hypothetical protein
MCHTVIAFKVNVIQNHVSLIKTYCSKIPNYKCIKFTGAGIFFWYQAGCAKYLQENNLILPKYNQSSTIEDVSNSFYEPHGCNNNVKILGSSAGALTATLLATNSNFDNAAGIIFKFNIRKLNYNIIK